VQELGDNTAADDGDWHQGMHEGLPCGSERT
jgi:hypothetical protein